VEPAGQAAGGVDPGGLVGRERLERGDRRAGPVMVEHQVEPPTRVDPLVEGDLDDLAEPLVVLGGPVGLDGGDDRLLLGDGAEVGPGGADLAGVEKPPADVADRLDVSLLVPGPGRLGQLGERADLDHRQAQVEPGPEQEGVEQGPEIAAVGQDPGEMVERLARTRGRQGPVDRVELGGGRGRGRRGGRARAHRWGVRGRACGGRGRFTGFRAGRPRRARPARRSRRRR